jgi:hypothetical protein
MEKWRCDVTAKPGPLDPGSLYHTKYLDETQPELEVLSKQAWGNLCYATHVPFPLALLCDHGHAKNVQRILGIVLHPAESLFRPSD